MNPLLAAKKLVQGKCDLSVETDETEIPGTPYTYSIVKNRVGVNNIPTTYFTIHNGANSEPEIVVRWNKDRLFVFAYTDGIQKIVHANGLGFGRAGMSPEETIQELSSSNFGYVE